MNECQAAYPPIPGLQPVMSITALIADGEALGHCIEGYRVNYPIIGGHFTGPQLKGEVLPAALTAFCCVPMAWVTWMRRGPRGRQRFSLVLTDFSSLVDNND